MTIDPYHWTGDVTEDEVVPEWTGPPEPRVSLAELLRRAGEPVPSELTEHYGPGPHKSGSPQSSHSAGGVGRATSATMAGIEQGGSSVRTSGMTPTSGIMVSYPPGSGHNSVIDATAPRAKVESQVREFVEAQRSFVTSKADRYIGGWVDGGKLHLDVSQNFPSSRREAAIKAGRDRNQLAVFDLDTFTDIPTGGTGTERLAAAMLMEHPGHSPQSVHGGGKGFSVGPRGEPSFPDWKKAKPGDRVEMVKTGEEGTVVRAVVDPSGHRGHLTVKWDRTGSVGRVAAPAYDLQKVGSGDKGHLTVKDIEGEVGRRDHVTRIETGTVPTSAIANLRGVKGEIPGQHRNMQGERWESFKADIKANGIREPIFITKDHGEPPKISEGNHRRDAAVELGLKTVPVEIRYFGHAERQGTVAP